MSDYSPGAGEHPNGRRAMEDLTRRLRGEGLPSDKVEKIARDTALREDRKRNQERK